MLKLAGSGTAGRAGMEFLEKSCSFLTCSFNFEISINRKIKKYKAKYLQKRVFKPQLKVHAI